MAVLFTSPVLNSTDLNFVFFQTGPLKWKAFCVCINKELTLLSVLKSLLFSEGVIESSLL